MSIHIQFQTIKQRKHPLDDVPHWIELIDGFSWLLVVVNCSSSYYVYKWTNKRVRKQQFALSVLNLLTGSTVNLAKEESTQMAQLEEKDKIVRFQDEK